MMTVEIPDTIGRLLPSEPSQRLRSVTEGLVLGAYTQGIITRDNVSVAVSAVAGHACSVRRT